MAPATVQQLRICLCRQLEVESREHYMVLDSSVSMLLVTVELALLGLYWSSWLSQSHGRQLLLASHLVLQ